MPKPKNVFKEPPGLVETGDPYQKPILEMTNREILAEVSDILGKPVGVPTDKIGWIAAAPEDYVAEGEVDASKLEALYDHGPLVDDYIVTLSLTSLRNRAPDLFVLIRDQKPGDKVLEFGCGPSTHGIACAQAGCDVHLFDVSTKMLTFAGERYHRRGLSMTVWDTAEALPDGFFDTILCTDVLEHVPDPLGTLETFKRVLKPGGNIHLHVSQAVNLVKGHLPRTIRLWKGPGQRFMKDHFDKITDHNYRKRADGKS